jgi:ABC-type molybdate transport system substrate-binding protein
MNPSALTLSLASTALLAGLTLLGGCAAGASRSAAPSPPAPVAEPLRIRIHAAGSLRTALTDLANSYERSHPGEQVRLTFGASGLLKDRLAAGEPSQVFASANMEHPEALLKSGHADSVQAFAANALCGLATPGFSLNGRPLAARLLDADVRVATSTPKADPAGDYAFRMFDRIETSGAGPAGSAQALKAKALQLTGGANAPTPPPDRSLYGQLMAEGRADVFITYCTNATQARREVPGLQVLDIPPAINIAARYGVALMRPVTPPARRFIDHLLSAEGRALLAAHGFSAP